MSASITDKNETNRIIVHNIKNSTVEEILRIVTPHFIESGYVKLDSKGDKCGYTMLIHLDPDSFYSDELDLNIEGYTEDGIITDSFGAIAVLDYGEMSFEQASWALETAIEYFKEE